MAHDPKAAPLPQDLIPPPVPVALSSQEIIGFLFGNVEGDALGAAEEIASLISANAVLSQKLATNLQGDGGVTAAPAPAQGDVEAQLFGGASGGGAPVL